MMSDDDGVEPQFEAVDKYHFVVAEDDHVCFSILPFQFDENDEVEDRHSKNKVYLRGHREMDKSHLVHKKVVAWRVGLDCEQPNISVLSSEGNWIKLLNPWKPYKDEIARSILITVQMLHFVRKQHRDKRSLWGRLWDHLNEVFDKLHTKPDMDDLRKHHPLIKLLLERDPTLMKLKILHRFIGDTTKNTKKPRTSGTQLQLTDSDDNDNGSDYDGTDSDYDEDDGNGDDSDYDEDDGNDDDSDYDEDDGSKDDGNNNGSDYEDGDDNSNVDTNNDDSTDELCALCDDGGNLLSCIGQCKRSFHPTKKDGRESGCKTLGYTSAQLKEIGSYLCNNCKYKQHQCFQCGELEPSAEPNAKVFKCKNSSCGHFYHPKCVAKLLEPDDSDGDESCELAQRIMEGMPFTCPVHWCFKCRRMEDRTQTAMQLAACRRCPKSYHRECLPREISFEKKGKNIKQRAWNLSGIVIIYCLDHEICEATGSAKRGHIKFPQAPNAFEISDRAEKKGKMANKLKRSIGLFSTKSTKVLNRSPREKIKHTQNSSEHMQTEPSMVGAANLSEQKVRKGQKRPSGSSLTSAVGSKTKKRKSSRPKKEMSTRTPCNIDTNCVDRSVQIADRLPLRLQPSDTQGNLLENPPVDKDAELNKLSKTPEDEDGIGKEQSSEHLGEENARNKNTSHENNEQSDAPDKPFGYIQAEVDQSNLKSRAEKLGENNVTGSIPGQEKDISVGENQMRQSTCEQDSRSNNGKNTRNENTKSGSGNGGMTRHHVDNPLENLIHVPHVDKMTITDRIHTLPGYDCDEKQEVNGGHAFVDEQINTQCNVDPEVMGIDTSDEKSIKRRKLNKMATVGSNSDLVENKRCDQGDGKEAHGGIQAEVDQSKIESRAETSVESGENANRHDSIPGLEKEISMGENQMRRNTCEQESRSDKGKIARNESTKSGSGIGGVTSDHVDDNPPEKLIHVSHVDKITITDTMHTHPEYDCDEEREGNAGHTFQDEPNSSQCSVDPKAMGIHTSAKNSRKRRKLKKKATSGDGTGLDESKSCNQGDGKGAHCDDSSYQGPLNDKEPDCHEHKFENSGCNDKNRASEVSEYKSRQSAGTSKMNNGAMGGNSRDKQRHHSANRQSNPYPATNYQLMYEQRCHVNRPSNGNFGPSHVPLQPVLLSPPAYCDANQLHNSYSYPRGLEHDSTGWQYSPYYPARPEHVAYAQNVNNLPIHGYYGRGNFVYGGYYASGIGPAAFQHNNGAHHPHTYVSMEGRGVRSNYTLGLGPQPPAAGSVTNKYAPHLELTNNWPRR
ncbi:hypothetical protein BS78_07G022300 [Paspalum vaginatum]|nr:hypothetical protein BS78_07G022300 [Paspalum vaginatum]